MSSQTLPQWLLLLVGAFPDYIKAESLMVYQVRFQSMDDKELMRIAMLFMDAHTDDSKFPPIGRFIKFINKLEQEKEVVAMQSAARQHRLNNPTIKQMEEQQWLQMKDAVLFKRTSPNSVDAFIATVSCPYRRYAWDKSISRMTGRPQNPQYAADTQRIDDDLYDRFGGQGVAVFDFFFGSQGVQDAV